MSSLLNVLRTWPSKIRAPLAIRPWCVFATMTALVACGGDTTAPNRSSTAHIRIINSVFQDNGSDTTGIALDYLLDSLRASPSVFGLMALSRSVGDSANGYVPIERGVHSFVARRAGDTSLNASLYTTSTDLPYLPKQFLTAGTYNTVIVAGVIPATGIIPNNTVPFTVFVDDPFPGPKVNAVVQARFRIANAAPYTTASGRGATVAIYLTPGSVAPPDITQYASMGTARYRNVSAYMNVDPGTYVVTLQANNVTVAQQAITFGTGEVRTLILQSLAAGDPSLGNNTVLNVLDHQY